MSSLVQPRAALILRAFSLLHFLQLHLHLQLGLNQCCGSKLFTAEPNCQLRDEADFACGCEIFSSGDPDPYGSL